MIEVDCPTCGKHLEIDSNYAGQSGRCNNCGGLVYAVEPRPIPKIIPKPRSRAKTAVRVLLFIPIALGLVALNASVYFDVSKPITDTESAAAAAMPLMHDALFDEIVAEMASQVLIPSDQSSDSYLESIQGRTVSWYGLVLESRQRLLGGFGARRKLIGGYEVWIDINRNGLQDVVFDVSGATARSLAKGQCIAFEGTIHSCSALQVNLVDVRITTTYANETTPAVPSYTPPPIPDPVYYQFTEQHRQAAISALRAAGFPPPESIELDGTMVIVQIRVLRDEAMKLGATSELVAQSAVLAVRNSIYTSSGSDPQWAYLVALKGFKPGPDLESLWGMSLLYDGSITWGEGDTLSDVIRQKINTTKR